jgi:hypothetical protein
MANALSMNVGDPVARAKAKPAAPKPETPPAAPKGDLVSRYQTFMEEPQRKLSEAAESEQKFKMAQEENVAARTAERMRTRGTALEAERTAIEESPAMRGLADVERQMEAPFTPTKDNAMDLATLYSLIGVVGFAIGAGGKGNAMAAMSAMNGMAQGYQQGRMDLYAREKDLFDTNLRQLKTRSDTLGKELERITKIASYDRQRAELEADALFAEQGANFMKEYTAKYGLPKSLELAKQNVQNSQKIFELKEKQEETARENALKRQYELQRMREHDQNMAALKTIAAQGGSRAMQQVFIAQRAVTALRGAASVMESVMRLPATADAGVLPNLQTKDGMFNYVRNNAARKLSSAEAKDIETLYSGMGRYLATIEASGTATGLTGLSQQMEKLQPKAGDTVGDIATKIADVRRVSTEAIQAMIDSGLLPGQAAEAAKQQVKRMEEVVPFTTNDVVDAKYAGRKRLGEAVTGVAQGGAKETYADPEKERRYQEWKARQP